MTWAEFITAVKSWMTTDANRRGVTQDLITSACVAGVRELQRSIPRLREGHTDEITSATSGVAALGEATAGPLPEGWWRGREARIIREVDEEDTEHPCEQRDWLERHKLIEGDLNCAYICLSPNALEFVMTPQLGGDENVRLVLIWDGIKQSFEDDDEVPFDEHCAQAVAYYVKAEVARQIDKDEGAFRSFRSDWLNERANIYLDNRKKGHANSVSIQER